MDLYAKMPVERSQLGDDAKQYVNKMIEEYQPRKQKDYYICHRPKAGIASIQLDAIHPRLCYLCTQAKVIGENIRQRPKAKCGDISQPVKLNFLSKVKMQPRRRWL